MRAFIFATAVFAAAPAMAQVTVTALPAGPIVENHGDLFDVSQGTVITGSTGGFSGFDARDAIGGSNPNSLEPGNFVFNDFLSAAQTQFIEFKTVSAVSISGFKLYLGESGGAVSSRQFDSVKLLGSLDNLSFINLGSVTFPGPDYMTAYGSHGILVQSLFTTGLYQYFRFEGLEPGFSGGRILELDAIAGTAVNPGVPGAVPEPAAWAMMIGGFGLIGGVLRRRTPPIALRL